MNRDEAFATVRRVLEEGGHHEALAEVRRTLHTLEDYEARGKALADVTRSLLESDRTYRLAFSTDVDPMAIFDPATGQLLDVNPSWVSLYGYTHDEALAMNVSDVSVEPSDGPAAVEELPPDGAPRVEVRWHRGKDGTVIPVEVTTARLRLIDGRVVGQVVVRDVTQRERSERTRARSEESYRALIESMPDGVIIGRKRVVVYLNPSMRRMLGYSPEDALGMPVLDLVHPGDRQQARDRIISIVSMGRTVPPVEERLLRRDGTSVITELMAMRTVFEGEPAVLAIVRDVTARKEIEAQLMLNDRLASLGRLAASVGHELNNPLAYVLGNVGFLEREISRASGVPEEVADRLSGYVKVVGEGARRMRDIVHDLKSLARSDGPENALVDLHHVLDVCTNMAEHELRPGTKIVRDFRDKAVVLGNETRLGQVFVNLLLNAAQAIPEGQGGDNEVRVVARAEGTRAVVEISDTGTGVPRALAD
ncbi:MAG TPA: PAS domain S-box protein, partial [Labilithrix sp.]|nr:PAS domain S-box protein [Labilithrix sp.]